MEDSDGVIDSEFDRDSGYDDLGSDSEGDLREVEALSEMCDAALVSGLFSSPSWSAKNALRHSEAHEQRGRNDEQRDFVMIKQNGEPASFSKSSSDFASTKCREHCNPPSTQKLLKHLSSVRSEDFTTYHACLS